MSTSARYPRRCIAVLKLPKYNTPLYISRAHAIVTAMAKSSWFPSPVPDLATVQSAIEELFTKEAATHLGGTALTAIRDGKRRELQLLLEGLRTYVQTIADANVDSAAAIIEGAGMYVKGLRSPGRAGFRLKDGRVAGEVDVFVDQAGSRAAYDWEYSLDGGVTWTAWPSTNEAKTTIRGLPQGARVAIRYRSRVKSAPSDWSEPRSIIVS